MKISEILNETAHRPWEMPTGAWRYYQEWNDALFLHWKVEAEVLRNYVPEALDIDEIDGSAWVSLVAFNMEKIRHRYIPPFPPISNFHEINVRTYVMNKGKAGVYFLSIEGGKALSCRIAKALSELPYRFSTMERAKGLFSSENSERGDKFKADYEIGEELKSKSEIDLWLTERYALFQDSENHLNKFEIHHIEWPIHRIGFKNLEFSYPAFDELITGKPDLIHYSPGVQVIAWSREKFYI